MELKQVKNIVEAALMASDEPLQNKQLLDLFPEEELTGNDINQVLNALEEEYQDRGVELKRLAKGYRLQTKESVQPWLQHLWDKKPRKLSRALLETLALIAYRQPITRGEIEDIRGVAVSSKIIHHMMDQEWVRVLGYRDVPGKPAMLGTTTTFLDYFNLSSLRDLPSLSAIKDMETLEPELAFGSDDAPPTGVAEVDETENEELDDEITVQTQDNTQQRTDELSDPEDDTTEDAS